MHASCGTRTNTYHDDLVTRKMQSMQLSIEPTFRQLCQDVVDQGVGDVAEHHPGVIHDQFCRYLLSIP